MKKYLQNLIDKKQKRAKELRQLINDAQTADEVRKLGEELTAVEDEEREAQKQLNAVEAAEGSAGNGFPAEESRNFNPLATFTQTAGADARDSSPYASLEYRKAFMAYVQDGTPIPAELRAGGDDGITQSKDIGAIIPETIMNEFVKEVTKIYGHIYSKVRKLNVKGGVKFPISKLKANFKWITESTVSSKQKAGDSKDFIVFNYNIGEIRVAETLLAQVVSFIVIK